MALPLGDLFRRRFDQLAIGIDHDVLVALAHEYWAAPSPSLTRYAARYASPGRSSPPPWLPSRASH